MPLVGAVLARSLRPLLAVLLPGRVEIRHLGVTNASARFAVLLFPCSLIVLRPEQPPAIGMGGVVFQKAFADPAVAVYRSSRMGYSGH